MVAVEMALLVQMAHQAQQILEAVAVAVGLVAMVALAVLA
jgi:hypothetical protein